MNDLIAIYTKSLELARNQKQTVGEKNDYYITLWQLEEIFKNVSRDMLHDTKTK